MPYPLTLGELDDKFDYSPDSPIKQNLLAYYIGNHGLQVRYFRAIEPSSEKDYSLIGIFNEGSPNLKMLVEDISQRFLEKRCTRSLDNLREILTEASRKKNASLAQSFIPLEDLNSVALCMWHAYNYNKLNSSTNPKKDNKGERLFVKISPK
ncbi:hypothetical protein KY330_05705 [Candidatus Woesearchaeota archaeon]|nr:hypothetical protein [Candidatus Woesearchaeota archaeon]